MKRISLVLAFLLQSVWAQPIPIEIDLVVPTSLTIPARPSWTAPPIQCTVCDSLKTASGCRCSEPITQVSAQELLVRVQNALVQESDGRLKLSTPVTIQAVSHQRLVKLGGEPLLGLYQDHVIWVSLDLSRQRALGVIAHELGHAWHFQNRSDIETPSELLFEGFAEFVSYLALKHFQDRDSLFRMREIDQSVYGRGARIFIAKYQREGLDSVLQQALVGN